MCRSQSIVCRLLILPKLLQYITVQVNGMNSGNEKHYLTVYKISVKAGKPLNFLVVLLKPVI